MSEDTHLYFNEEDFNELAYFVQKEFGIDGRIVRGKAMALAQARYQSWLSKQEESLYFDYYGPYQDAVGRIVALEPRTSGNS